MKSKQIPLPILNVHGRKYRKRKTARPISLSSANHVIFKSSIPVLRRHHLLIKQLVVETQKRFFVSIYSMAIMENHCHFLISTNCRTQFANAMRFLAGQIALKISRKKVASRKNPADRAFWITRMWSRIVRRGRDFLNTKRYISQNPLKAGIFDEVDFFEIQNGRLVFNSS